MSTPLAIELTLDPLSVLQSRANTPNSLLAFHSHPFESQVPNPIRVLTTSLIFHNIARTPRSAFDVSRQLFIFPTKEGINKGRVYPLGSLAAFDTRLSYLMRSNVADSGITSRGIINHYLFWGLR